MARVILSNNETFTVFNSTANVEGGTGSETLLIGGTSSAVTVSQTIERVDLKGNVGDYTYQAAGNQVKVFSNGTLVTTITAQDDSNGTTVAFADGATTLKISALDSASLGNQAIGSSAAVSVSATALGSTFDTTTKSASTSLGGTTTPTTGQTFTLTTGVDGTYSGTNFTGGSGNDIFISVDSSSGTSAWSSLDVLDGGAGTDTFSVTSVNAISLPTGAKVTNIETLNLTSAATASSTTASIDLDTTSDFAGLLTINATGNGKLNLAAAATTDVSVIDATQSNGAISVSGGKNTTLIATAKDVVASSAIRTGAITVGTSTAPAAGSVSITSTDTLAVSSSAPSNITVLGGTGVTVSQTVKAGFALTAAASPTSTAADGTAGTISVGSSTNPATGAVSITSDTNVTSSAAITVVGQKVSVTGGSSVTVNQTASTIQTAAAISTVTIGDVSVTGSAATTSVSVSQPVADSTGALAVTAANATAAVAGTVGVTAVTASPGVTGVTAVTAVSKASANPVTTGTPVITNGVVTIADKNAGSTTLANTISSVTLSNYASGSTISSTALNTLNLSSGGGTLGITEGGSTATIAANKTLTVNAAGGTYGVLTDSSNQFSTVNAVLTASSTLGGIADTALRTVNVSGTGVLTLSSVNSAITSITTTGAAGFKGDISGTGVTSFTGANSTANNTVTLNAATQSYTGGTGVDTVTVGTDALKAISGGSGTDVLVMETSVTPTAAGMKAKVSGFETLSTPTTSGTINMANMPSDIVTVRSTGASGGVSFTNVADGTALEITGAHVSGTTSYTLAATGGANKSVTVTLGASTATTGLDYGTVQLRDVNSNGIGIVNVVSNGLNVATGSTANYNTVVLTNPGISTLNVSGTAGLNLGTSYTDTVTALTINNSITGNYGLVIPNLVDTSLDTLTFTGSGTTSISGINNGTIANLTITNSGTGKANIAQIWSSNSGTTDTSALTSLTLAGDITTGTKAAPLEIGTTSGAVTVSGATDNAGVAIKFTGTNSNATTVTLGNGNNYVYTVATTGGGDITTGSGMDWVQQGSLGAATNSSLVSTGAGMDTIVTGPGFSGTVVTNAAGGSGADYIQVQSSGSTPYVSADGTAGKYGSVVWAGDKTTGSTVTTGTFTGLLYAESPDSITSSGVIQPTFKTVFAGNLVNTSGAGKIFMDANIVAPIYGEGAILVASTAKDVFFFQTGVDTDKGKSAGGSNVENFKIGQDIIAVTNYQSSGDNLFVGSAAAATAINAVTAGEALLASTNGWSWTLDLNSTTSGTLAYVGAIGASPTNANLSIHLIGVQGTIAGVDSFFYQG